MRRQPGGIAGASAYLHLPWSRIHRPAGRTDVSIHDLSHSFASRALAHDESLSMIGKLLGHNKIDTTSRYAHLVRDSIQASSARVADSIGADILNSTSRVGAPTA